MAKAFALQQPHHQAATPANLGGPSLVLYLLFMIGPLILIYDWPFISYFSLVIYLFFLISYWCFVSYFSLGPLRLLTSLFWPSFLISHWSFISYSSLVLYFLFLIGPLLLISYLWLVLYFAAEAQPSTPRTAEATTTPSVLAVAGVERMRRYFS